MRKLILVTVLTVLTGCATVAGVGQDISGGAERVGGWFN